MAEDTRNKELILERALQRERDYNGVLKRENMRLFGMTRRYNAKIERLQEELQTFKEKNSSQNENNIAAGKVHMEELEAGTSSLEKPAVDQQPVENGDLIGLIFSTLKNCFPDLTREMVVAELHELRKQNGGIIKTKFNDTIEHVGQILADKLHHPIAPRLDPHAHDRKNECAICCEQIEFTCRGCNYKYHFECVDEWLQEHKICPMCRLSRLLPE